MAIIARAITDSLQSVMASSGIADSYNIVSMAIIVRAITDSLQSAMASSGIADSLSYALLKLQISHIDLKPEQRSATKDKLTFV